MGKIPHLDNVVYDVSKQNKEFLFKYKSGMGVAEAALHQQ